MTKYSLNFSSEQEDLDAGRFQVVPELRENINKGRWSKMEFYGGGGSITTFKNYFILQSIFFHSDFFKPDVYFSFSILTSCFRWWETL